MNDIHEASQNFLVILYDDDTKLPSPISYFSPPFSTKEGVIEEISSNINSELNDIQEWLSINKLSLNVKKQNKIHALSLRSTIVMFATDAHRYYLNSCLLNFICPLHDPVQFLHDSYLLSPYSDFYYISL